MNARFLAAAALAAAALTIPASASASTVSLDPGGGDEGSKITYTAAPGEANKVDVKVTGGTAEIDDPGATITAGANCVAAPNGKKATCTNPSRPSIDTFFAALGDGNDSFDAAGVFTRVEGGVGNDDLGGGEKTDVFDGGGGTDTLRGNAGDDHLTDGDTTGATNKDTLIGGDGTDTVSYKVRTATVAVDLADNAGDGEAGENDTVAAVENAEGGSGNDVIGGTDGPNGLGGNAGNDEVDGRGGDDIVLGRAGNDLLIGGAGRDDIEGEEGDDKLRLDNPAGVYDKLTLCGSGKDTIVGIGPSPFVERGCEVGDFGFGYVAGLQPKSIGTTSVTIKVPCPDAYRKNGVCKGSVVVEPKGAYAKDAATRKKNRYGVAKFSISKSSGKVRITLNSAGRKQLRKSSFKLQFQVNLKETATSTKRAFVWTNLLVKSSS